MDSPGIWAWRAVPINCSPSEPETGTAQYYADNHKLTLAWFIGFMPAENPQIALAIVVEGKILDPQNPGKIIPLNVSGGSTAAPIGKAILEAFLRKQSNYSSAPSGRTRISPS